MSYLEKRTLSRQKLLRLASMGLVGVAGSSILAACGDPTATTPAAAATITKAGESMTTKAATAMAATTTEAAMAPLPTKIRFGVGPLQATPADSKKTYEPFFKYLAEKLGIPSYELVATTDWAGISVALANDQVDLAWMGPWGYVLANNDSGVTPLATVKYDSKPIYHAIIVARPGLEIKTFPDDAKGLKMSFADLGSTSGWLIPTFWFKSKGIDPKTYFQYSEGATHAANEIAVANSQSDLATDFDRNRNAMIESGKLEKDGTKIVWTSDPLPNDAIAVKKGFDPALAKKVQDILLAITEEQSKTFMPNHYNGFVAATHKDYLSIEAAGVAVGRLKQK